MDFVCFKGKMQIFSSFSIFDTLILYFFIRMETFQFLIRFGSFLCFPFLIFLGWWFYTQKSTRFPAGFFIIFTLLFIWMRFIEPQIIIITHQNIPLHTNLRIAVISDIHLGLFKDEHFLESVVEKINATQADVLFIAGDFTYRPKISELPVLFAPLQKLRMPVYAVLGNHDTENPGEPLRDELKTVLQQYNVQILENEKVYVQDITLLGLGDHWAEEDNTSLLQTVTPEEKVIVLTHNPDTISNFPNSYADLTVCGHTHGGQIRIPWLYKKVIPTIGDFDTGLTREKNTALFITSGLGEIGLPMRFLNFPEIVILEGQ